MALSPQSSRRLPPIPIARRKTLRVAVLTMLAPAGPSPASRRAFLRVGGISVARQQTVLALHLNCERVICIAAGLGPELLEIQHLVEAAGANFHVIANCRGLSRLVTAVDEVIVFDDGLFASTTQAAGLLEEGQAVLVQPVEAGLAAGFERVDLNHASAGAMRLPGRLVERLIDLPADCDVASALLRIGLQAGIRQRQIPIPGQDGLFWTLLRSEDEAHALEPQWVRHRTRDEGALSPARAVALGIVRGLGPAMLHAGTGARAVVIGAAVLALMAIGAGWFGLAILGLGFAATGWLLRDVAVLLARIEADPGRSGRGLDKGQIYGWLIDGLIIVLAAWGSHGGAGWNQLERYFAPFMLVAILRLMPRLVSARWAGWFGDRALLAAGVGAAMATGFGSGAIQAAAALLALAALALPLGQSRLTRP